MALRLILGRDGFSNFLSQFKILRGHLDQTRPNSSNNVRKQISIGCYYDHSVFKPFKPVRFELLGRTEDEYKCNRGMSNTSESFKICVLIVLLRVSRSKYILFGKVCGKELSFGRR